MVTSTLRTAIAAAVLGAAALTGSAAPASADSLSFGFTVGAPPRLADWDRPPPVYVGPPPVIRYYDRWERPRNWDRPRRVQVCRDVWRKKRVHDEWGRLVKVIRYVDQDCRWKRR